MENCELIYATSCADFVWLALRGSGLLYVLSGTDVIWGCHCCVFGLNEVLQSMPRPIYFLNAI